MSSSSSANLSPILPSVFELLAQERFTRFIRSGLRQVLSVLQTAAPLSTSLKILYQYKDELVLVLEGILQWFYLHFHSALAGEHYYGFRRTANHRLRSLILSVFLPYVKVKLESFHEQIRSDQTHPLSKFSILRQVLPKILIFFDGICWLYRLSYGFGVNKYYSPTLQLASAKLTYAKDPSPIVIPRSMTSRLFSLISQIISSGLFLIQIIDWWKSVSKDSPSRSKPMMRRSEVQRQCLLCRQTCQKATGILGSGYVYCYDCVADYITLYHRCPTTHRPVTHEHLVRLHSI